VTQEIQKGLLRSLELARIARKPADNLDAFGHELRGRLKLLVDSITARGGGLELLLEAVVPPVGPILPPLGAILSSCDRVENRLDAFEARADLTLHDAQISTGQDAQKRGDAVISSTSEIPPIRKQTTHPLQTKTREHADS